MFCPIKGNGYTTPYNAGQIRYGTAHFSQACIRKQAGILAVNLRPGGSFTTHDWLRKGRLASGRLALGAGTGRTDGGPPLAGRHGGPCTEHTRPAVVL